MESMKMPSEDHVQYVIIGDKTAKPTRFGFHEAHISDIARLFWETLKRVLPKPRV